ncbi:beta-ketoacyl-[acyl-carrier-protein] synthase family protein [Streptomyces sp. ME19-01-6]|uniref:beta-ketoacyl-[acyl-carrier-protein] synthase family protein n=1 Tax=Streptomyces sp. ME19-01-6 TaxID=3028686 RepID=UPI0029B317CA|nr:beta-ketoacyl-[acyl-carrier-protein] synthase family protein [Streptomyces sp. ME19-01-6]MDX3233763.1 beta-ketoacyl-[acyl-carrier-protein] synthase family protein [Streptomyces sp. ME19-01-6]
MTADSTDVLVTGLGALSCLGSGIDALWRGMHTARSAPTRVPDPLAHMDHPHMYLVPEADLPVGPEELDGVPLGRASQFAIEAAREAVQSAGLTGLAGVDPRRVAVAISSGMGDSDLHERRRAGEPAKHERWAPVFPVASAVGGWLGAQGANTSLSNACAASGYALSVAADLIRSGEAEVVVAGGTEAYSRAALACFNRLGAIDPERCRPFAADRRGTIFGEGAAVLVLESAAHARARGAKTVYARLAGTAWSCDAHHATAPEPGGAQIERAMREALREANPALDPALDTALDTAPGAGPGRLGFVVPHGTGTELNDVVEARALSTVLGEAAPLTPLYSVKALLGHTGGAAGAFAALVAVLVLHHKTLPPNVPVGPLDPGCEVPLPAEAIPMTAPYGLVNAYAFGGNNVSLVLQEAGS